MSLAASIDALDPADQVAALRTLAAAWAPPRLRYVPPAFGLSPKQEFFLALPHREAFFGGAAGPGKSTALLAGALQYADVPGYSALILRRTYADLSLPGALMDMAHEWLDYTDAKWSAARVTWTFPSRATLTFGHLEHEEQKRRYASARFQYIAFDELSQFSETQYTFLFSRLRRPAVTTLGRAPDGVGVAGIPLRMRSASNPGGPGHGWVKRRLVDPETRYPGAAFVPAKLIENRHLDVKSYAESLAHVGPVERERLLHGDWDVTELGTLFRATLWMSDRYLDDEPLDVVQRVRHWDFASTEQTATATDPDYTVGTKLGLRLDGSFVVLDVARFRAGPAEVERQVAAVAAADGRETHVGLEQEPGSSGKALVDYYQRRVLAGYVVHGERPTGDKQVRAVPVASAMQKQLVWAVRGRWLAAWLDELDGFPGEHDDQVDSLSGAHTLLTRGGPLHVSRPTGRVPTRVVRDATLPGGGARPAAVVSGAPAPTPTTNGNGTAKRVARPRPRLDGRNGPLG